MRVRFGLLAFLISVVGCGPNVAPVSGKVTLNDKPLANAKIVFEPITGQKNPGPGSLGETDESGNFSLKLIDGSGRGALVGKHKVIITAYDDKGPDGLPAKEKYFGQPLLGPEYNEQSKLTFDVPSGGTTTANFDLKSGAK